MSKTKLPSVGVIAVNFNGKHYLGSCLTSLINHNYPRSSYELILVDNNSNDGSEDYVRKAFPSVRIIKLKRNRGWTDIIKNNNAGKVTRDESEDFARGILELLDAPEEIAESGLKLLIKASIWPIRNLKTIWKKRVMIQRRRKVSDDWLIRNQLLLPIRKTLKLVMQLRNH